MADDDLMGLEESEGAEGAQLVTMSEQCQDGGMPQSSEPLANAMELEPEHVYEEVTLKHTQSATPLPRPVFGLTLPPTTGSGLCAAVSAAVERSPLPRRRACARRPEHSIRPFAMRPPSGAAEEDLSPLPRRRTTQDDVSSMDWQQMASNNIYLAHGSTEGDARNAQREPQRELETTEQALAKAEPGEQQLQQQHLGFRAQPQLLTREHPPIPERRPPPPRTSPEPHHLPAPKHMLPTRKQPPPRPPPQQRLLSSKQAAGSDLSSSDLPGSGVGQITAGQELEPTEEAVAKAGAGEQSQHKQRQKQKQQQHQHRQLNLPAQPQQQQPTPKPAQPPGKPLPAPQQLATSNHMRQARKQPLTQKHPPPPPPPCPRLPPPPAPLPSRPSVPATMPASQRRLSSLQATCSNPPGNGRAGHKHISKGSPSARVQREAPVVPATKPVPPRPFVQAARRTPEDSRLPALSFLHGKADNHYIIMTEPISLQGICLYVNRRSHVMQCRTRSFVGALPLSCFSHCSSRDASEATPFRTWPAVQPRLCCQTLSVAKHIAH